MNRFVIAIAAMSLLVLSLTLDIASAAPIVRGVGNANLKGATGGDLTDLGNDGVEGSYTFPAGTFPANLGNFNATFFASSEANFGSAEAAYNVFDNQTVGGGDNKWCCNAVSNAIDNSGQFVGADFSKTLVTGNTNGIVLSAFTLTSGNDSPGRDPDVFSIQGSNDGTNWTNIFTYSKDGTTPWTAGGDVRDQVLEWSTANGDFAQPGAFKQFRLFVDSINGDGAGFQLDELEFFGSVKTPEPASIALWSILGLVGTGFAWRMRKTKLPVAA